MAPMKAAFATCVLISCLLLGSGFTNTSTGPTDYQKLADEATWDWDDEQADPLKCALCCDKNYDVRILCSNKEEGLVITILSGTREIYSWRGHGASVFCVQEDKLFYADFSPVSTGGHIIAIDLNSGTELWNEPLQALGDPSHFAYSNRINMFCSGSVLSIYGNEAFGRYIEYKKVDTGTTVGNKILPEEKGSQ